MANANEGFRSIQCGYFWVNLFLKFIFRILKILSFRVMDDMENFSSGYIFADFCLCLTVIGTTAMQLLMVKQITSKT